jgi:glycosyltransferase involved in cell wall biosynthesis
MISVCIPVYNCRVTGLIRDLSAMIASSGVTAEIVIIDDRSADQYREDNRKACQDHMYILLEKNIGRSRIRNLFLDYARYPYLLFLDCDSVMTSAGFLLDYIKEIQRSGASVICGGLTNQADVPPGHSSLRWKYGKCREENPASLRNQDPYGFFRSNNFLADRKVFDNIRFDERITGYGYEDTLFAYHLMKDNMTVSHIDNPVLHCCMESNREFLEKSENGVSNLVAIMEYINYEREFIRKIRLLRTYQKIRRWHLLPAVRRISGITRPVLKALLVRGYGRLWMLDLYKLGILLRTDAIKKGRF